MRGTRLFSISTMLLGGCLAPSLFLCARADTVRFKNRNEIKGLVVEKHADRVIISTEQGELPVMFEDIETIEYDDPAQSFFDLGKINEAQKRFGVALAYYEKAIELNPNHEEAKRAALSMRSRFWASSNERPLSEIDKQQSLHDSWSSGRPIEEVTKRRSSEQTKQLRDGLGVVLEKKGDWVRLSFVDPKKPAFATGLRKSDRLISIDGESLRYLSEAIVGSKLISPWVTSCTLEFERDAYVRLADGKSTLKALGLKLKLEYQGVIVQQVQGQSSADRAGLRQGDLVTRVGGAATRYMPMRKVVELIENAGEEGVPMTIRRSALLMRV